MYQYEAKPITFHTFKTQRVIITAGGFVGIGTPSPSNMLHVNNIYNGRLFRTDGANANTNYWQFFTNNVEKFRLSVLANDSNVTLNVIQNKSMIFNTNNALSMYIRGNGRTYVGKNNLTDAQMINRFTIDSDSTDATSSGLRFINLTKASTPISNPGSGVLAVDSLGNVIYVNASSAFVPCSDSLSKLLENSKIDLNNRNLYFTNNDSLIQNHVGIGYACGDVLPGKLSVHQFFEDSVEVSTRAGYFLNTNVNKRTLSGVTFSGVQGESIGGNYHEPGINAGGNFYATRATRSFGVYSNSLGSDTTIFATAGDFTANYGRNVAGVEARAYGGFVRNYGGKFKAESMAGTTAYGVYTEAIAAGDWNYGVYALANQASNNIGIYAQARPAMGSALGPNFAGYFDGDVYVTGSAFVASDENLKENIEDFTDANAILAQLNPKRYNFKTNDFPQLHLSESPQIGLIAQELEQLLPIAVGNIKSPPQLDSLGNVLVESIDFKGVDYDKLIPILVGGHQEQQAETELVKQQNLDLQNQLSDLQNQFNQLQACLQNMFPNLCQLNPHGMIQQNTPAEQNKLKNEIEVQLSNKNAIILNQNVPNPFAEKTVISYSIPETIGKAQIHFYDAKGNLIQTQEINERGAGQLNVFGSDLSSGMYSYSLVADGKVVDTKRMVKSN